MADDGMDEMEYIECRSNFEDLSSEYQQYAGSPDYVEKLDDNEC